MVTGVRFVAHPGVYAGLMQIRNQRRVEQQMIDGRRVTDAETLKIVTMVYAGYINKSIVSKLQQFGANAMGLTGADAQTITAIKRPIKTIDYGFVGDIVDVNTPIIYQFLNAGITPIFAPSTV